MTPKVTARSLPAGSDLHRRVGPRDFLDCFAVTSPLAARRAAEVITAFPGWVRHLLQVRRWITAPFGLSNDGPPAPDKLGPFPVEQESPDEVIAGFDDKHLNFRVAVRSEGGEIYLATWVHPHNWGGWLYLRAILPFHILVARNALRRVAAAETGPA